jgi:hypothetical protein
MSHYTNPYPEGTTEHRVWIQGASAALTSVQVVGESGGEYVDNLVMEAETMMGLVNGKDENWPVATTSEVQA